MSSNATRDLSPSEDGSDVPLEALLPRRKLVVAIGIDEYAHLPRLRCAVSDALGVQELLVQRFGFEAPIPPLLNKAATKPDIEALVEDQLRRILEPEDALVLFFAGHGTTRVARLDSVSVETGYIAPVEARGADHFSGLINMEELLRKCGMLPARHILVVLDACHSGMALGGAVSQYRSIDAYAHRLARNRSRRVITSARRDEPALDSGPVMGHSLFTGTLIQALTSGEADLDRNGIVTFSELALFLQQRVGQSSGSRQTPDYGAFHLDDRGELLIAASAAPPAAPAMPREHAPEPARPREPVLEPARAREPAPGPPPRYQPAPAPRAERRRKTIEDMLAHEAAEHAQRAPAGEHAAIQERHERLDGGLRALRARALASGWRGSDAPAALPWYVLMGAPGAGKTTALLASSALSLVHDAGLPGVGGSRHCTFWLSREAVVLETACAHAARGEDGAAWMTFLRRLAAQREGAPVNGVLLAVSVEDLLGAPGEQTARLGAAFRARIDEVQHAARAALPVYVLLTKCDRIAGFAEYFADLRTWGRDNPWGATVRLDEDRTRPGGVVEREFDVLVERLHGGVVRRILRAESQEAREQIFQFPLEFAAMKARLLDLMTAAFSPDAGAAPAPILRGFYFTSGTQGEPPAPRLSTAIGRAVGLVAAPPEPAQPAQPEQPAAKAGYFLHGVLARIVLPDQGIAARADVVARTRRRAQQTLGMACVITLVGLLVVPALVSYRNNRALIEETRKISEEVGLVGPRDTPNPARRLDRLERLRAHLTRLDLLREDTPLSYGWFMFQGDELFAATLKQYLTSLREECIQPVKRSLEASLRDAGRQDLAGGFEDLKGYLLLKEHRYLRTDSEFPRLEMNVRGQVQRLTERCAQHLQPSAAQPEDGLAGRIRPHMELYVDLQRRGAIEGEPVDEAIIDAARIRIGRVSDYKLYYDRFVTGLADVRYAPSLPPSRENHKYPSARLADVFADRPVVLTILRSARKERTGQWYEVLGPYTAKGRKAVLGALEVAQELVDKDQWVLPKEINEENRGLDIRTVLVRVRQDYDGELIRQWEAFFEDIQVDRPYTTRETIEMLTALATAPAPYQQLLQRLSEVIRLDEQSEEDEAIDAAGADGGLLAQIRERTQRRLEGEQNKTPRKVDPRDPVSGHFASLVRFGAPATPEEGGPPPPAPELSKYIALLAALRSDLLAMEDRGPLLRHDPRGALVAMQADYAKARAAAEEALKQTRVLVLSMDETGQELLGPLLTAPLLAATRVGLCPDGTPVSAMPCRAVQGPSGTR